MYSLKFVTEKNKEYCFENISLKSGVYEQDGVTVTIKKQGRCSKILVRAGHDRVKRVYHTYSTSLRNFNHVIVPDSGRNFFGVEQTVYFWTRNFASRVNDVKSPLYILCGQDNCASLCFGVIGKDYEREFKSVEPHGGRALSLYGRTLTLQISGKIPEEYREENIYEEGIYLMDEPKNTGIPWTEALREFHKIRKDWEQIVLPYTKASMYPMWCSWTDWDSAKVNEQVVRENVEEGLKLGIQNYIIDDGWFGLGLDCDEKLQLNIGDWESEPEKFPDLLRFSREEESAVWDAYEMASRITKGRIPVVLARGNHDTRGRYAEMFSEHFPRRTGNSYYTFRLGNIWGLVLDCGEDKEDTHPEYGGLVCCHDFREKETAYIKQVICQAKEEYDEPDVAHRIVICHIPFTTLGEKDFDIERETYAEWVGLLREHIKPEMILCGHVHTWEIYNCGSERDAFGQSCPTVVGSERATAGEEIYLAGTGLEFSPAGIDVTFQTVMKR